MPGIGTVTSNLESELDMADKYSEKGIKAIEMGERYANLGAKAAGGDMAAIGKIASQAGVGGLAGQATKMLTRGGVAAETLNLLARTTSSAARPATSPRSAPKLSRDDDW